ncbi:MAG: 4-(cytidine 5'-diphospho)-2-C-methyl-D-erythritol kinase [Armatimonadota bacterium]|nr:4-(cytidine 5'-diphospho)-2-C-methyl-D-erythritol kinase [Armatimonadota bacterium]MDR7464604.1 4-(cytidine 5'-diphospho)-2-C-methyl-D-erythritol kinase [Armatimonadota bacterium]MDR7469011.1 4-(cytidine 5'-diphospho)-2-C-methyl-D-erythritol kinase [Armatimonadota bacterium]MDR7538052.1 4-(cytidine 5'-diphospho)-2-C-methyl-D-erythritol kinase [Armatimonadota bacterium]
MLKELHLNAYAKVNLALDVLGPREDGFHEIETVLHTVELHDTITLREQEDGITVRTDDPAVPDDARNLVVRAAQVLRETFQVSRGVDIEIKKGIPVGSGLGGGSSDAAITLLGLVQMWKLRLNGRGLLSLAATLGSDVPFFLEGGAAIARGRGERVTWLPPLPTTWVVLARPRVEVSTAWAYQVLDLSRVWRRPDVAALVAAMRREDVAAVGRLMGNVFEELLVQHHPVVGELKQLILAGEAYGAALSGTGPTVFGLMANEAAARKTADDLRALPDVDVLVSRTFAEER